MQLPLHTYFARHARLERLSRLRNLAQRENWAVVGITDDLSNSYVVPPLFGGLSAQAELACSGQYHGWRVFVAYVDARSLPSDRDGKSGDEVALLCLVRCDFNASHLVASRVKSGLEVAALTPEAETLLPRVTEYLSTAAAAGLRIGDTLAARDRELILVHPVAACTRSVNIPSYLRIVQGLAAVLRLTDLSRPT